MLEKLIIPIVAGLFGLLPALLQWISDRNKTRSRTHQISKLGEELSFIEQWTKLSGPDSGERSTDVKRHLNQILDDYGKLRASGLKTAREPGQVSRLRRLFLLFRPTTGTGWVIHSVFYVLLFFVIAVILTGLEDPIINPETGENDFFYLILGTVIIFGPGFFILQRMAIRTRNRELEKTGQTPTT